MRERNDVVIVGAGHNALVAAVLLGRAGLRVHVVEEQPVIGGAVRTEAPFARVPGLRTSTGAYLLGLMPPELVAELGLELPLIRRDPHYFLPTTGERYLLLGGDEAVNRAAIARFFSEADARAHEALQRELAALREDLAPSWLEPPLGLEETAERWVRPELRRACVELCRGSIAEYLGRFGFESELLMAMYAVTDAFSGLSGGWDSPGTGMNFLVHNLCRLPGSDGTWMVVQGGMGVVTDRLAEAAVRAGVTIETGVGVRAIQHHAGSVRGVELADGRHLAADVVVVGADPFRMRALVSEGGFPAEYLERLRGYERPGTTLKVNLALSGLPRFSCLPEPRGQHHTTTHLLPQQDVLGALRRAHADALAGRLPERPAIEWYNHTPLDPSLRDPAGHHNAALFVQWVPNAVQGSSWERELDGYVDHLLGICDEFAPGTSELVVDRFALAPSDIARHFGMSFGHIHHIDNSFGFADRLPYATPLAGLYSASAGCHPAGSVIGAAGHNCAKLLLRELGRG